MSSVEDSNEDRNSILKILIVFSVFILIVTAVIVLLEKAFNKDNDFIEFYPTEIRHIAHEHAYNYKIIYPS